MCKINDQMDLRLKLGINLQSFSAITVAVNLWEEKEVHKLVIAYFLTWRNHPFKTPENRLWKMIENLVFKHLSLLNLSEEVSSKVKNLIEPIGDKIYYWNLFLLNNLKLNIKYTFKIYWTQYGTIDVSKIFNLFWVKMYEKTDGPWIVSNHDIILLACLFAQKEFIKQNINQFRKGIELFIAPNKISNINKINVYGIMVIRLYIEMVRNKDIGIQMYKTVKNWGAVASDLFSWSCFQDYYETAKFFWNKLDECEKKRLTKQKAKACFRHVLNYNRHGNEKEREIFIFLINNLELSQREKIILKYLEQIFEFCLYVWPYNEVINLILEECLNRLSPGNRAYFFNFIIRIISKDDFQAKKEIIKEHVYKEIFPKALNMVSKEGKIDKLINDDNFLQKMFECFNISILSAILNDTDLSDYKNEILDRNLCKFKDLIRTRNFKKIDKFVANAFNSESEIKQFKLKLNFVEELLIEGKYYLADELLTWISDSNDDRILLKKQINAMKIFSEFTNIFQMNRFLQWLFDTELERDNFKQTLKNDEFMRDRIMKIYNENNKARDSQCYEFLKWICGTEAEAVEMKKKFVFEEDVARKFSAFLPSPESFKKINELGLLFDLAPEEELSVKQKIVSNKDEWIFTYTVSRKKC